MTSDEPKRTRSNASIVNIFEGRLLTLIRKKWESEGTPLILPGGGIHKGDKPDVAAVREFFEETGIVISKFMLEPFDKIKTEWTDEMHVFNLTQPVGPKAFGYFLITPEWISKFTGCWWIDLSDRKMLERIKPLCMHGLQQLIERHWL